MSLQVAYLRGEDFIADRRFRDAVTFGLAGLMTSVLSDKSSSSNGLPE